MKKIGSLSLAGREIQIKTALIFCLIPVKMTIIINTKTTDAGDTAREKEPLILLSKL